MTTVFTEEPRVLFRPEVETPVKGRSARVENHLFPRARKRRGSRT